VTKSRRFPPPWSVEETEACFIVRLLLGSFLSWPLYEAREKSKVGGTDTLSKRGVCSVPPSTVPFGVFRNTLIETHVPPFTIGLVGHRNRSEQQECRPIVPDRNGPARNSPPLFREATVNMGLFPLSFLPLLSRVGLR
jgi:hypothetical protein